ncbi:MAG: protein BatD [bacterium]|nr:protein BatD [bacterium]
MRLIRFCTLLCLLICSTSVLAVQADLQVQVALHPDTVGLDEQTTLEVTVSGSSQNVPEVEIPSLPSFEIYSQGRSSSVSIVNGQVSASVAYRYLLLPQKPGSFPIQGISVTVNGKKVVGNSVLLVVQNKRQATSPKLEDRAVDGQGGNKDYFLEALIDKKNPYVSEQVTLTLKFYIAVQYYSSPQLDEPATTGFWTEVVGNSAPYFQRINNRNYRVIERKYALFPTQTGELTIGKAAITTTVAARNARRDPFDMFGDLFPQGQQIAVRSEPIKINVKPLPAEGKPEDFTGTVGKFEISASADKTEVELNQPVTVRVKISGVGNIKSVGEPMIAESNDFRVYRAASNENVTKVDDKIGGTKIYEEVFVPKRPGMLQIPALSFNYFDPKTNKYQVLRTQPISLSVVKPEGYVASPDVPFAGPSVTVGTQAQDIRFIKQDPGELKQAGEVILFSPLYLAVNGIPVLVLAGMIFARKRKEMLASNVGLARARGASSQARKRLAKAKSLARPESIREFYGELSLAFMQYVADKLNISPNGLTSDMIAELLRERKANPELIADTLGLLKQCDFARFAPANLSQQDMDAALGKAEAVMVKIEGVRFA